MMQFSWKNEQELTLYGWAYGLNAGFVTNLDDNFSSDLDEVYQLKFLDKDCFRAVFICLIL